MLIITPSLFISSMNRKTQNGLTFLCEEIITSFYRENNKKVHKQSPQAWEVNPVLPVGVHVLFVG